MRSLVVVVLMMACVLAVNWPASKVRCQVVAVKAGVVSGEDVYVERGQAWEVMLDASEWEYTIIDDTSGREIVSCRTKRGRVFDIKIDERFDGVNECWMLVMGK